MKPGIKNLFKDETLMCDTRAQPESSRLWGITAPVITPLPSCSSSLITIYMLYWLMKTPERDYVFHISIFSGGPQWFHPARFIAVLLNATSFDPVYKKQFVPLKPAATFLTPHPSSFLIRPLWMDQGGNIKRGAF